MGYYSTFEVLATNIPNIGTVLNTLDQDNDWASPGWESWNDTVQGCDSAKWYDWLTDLEDLATMYPDKYLVMERCGEESPDVSRAVVKHGRVVEIVPKLVWSEVP